MDKDTSEGLGPTAADEYKKLHKALLHKRWAEKNPEKIRAYSYNHYHTTEKIKNAERMIAKYQKILEVAKLQNDKNNNEGVH